MNILDILTPDAIKAPLESTSKQDIINELVDRLAANGSITDPGSLKSVVWEREQQRSTGIGEGVAIPHGKSACSSELVLAIGRPAAPVDFDAIDKRPVRMIFLLASPPDRTPQHIQALGKISRLMCDVELRQQLFDAETPEAIYTLIEDAEHASAS